MAVFGAFMIYGRDDQGDFIHKNTFKKHSTKALTLPVQNNDCRKIVEQFCEDEL
jgi:hypothetical protein